MTTATNSTVTLIAEFTTTGILVKTPDGKQQKPISAPDFVKTLLAQLPSAIEANGSSVLLPLGTIYSERTVNSFRIAIYVPEHVHKYVLQEKGTDKITEYMVPMPNIIFEARMRINESGSYGLDGQAYSFYCTSLPPDVAAQRFKKGFSRIGRSGDGMGELGAGFHYLPVTNIYPSGYLCLGGNSVETVFKPDNLLPLGRYIDVCLNSPGNNDLSIPGLVLGKTLYRAYGDRNPGRMFAEWATLSSFPYDNVEAFGR